jgi:histidinol-phosphate phosphatase family protein
VPLPVHRRPTDWERNVAGLAAARWATADMAYRRRVLVEAGGFDERFPRAFREDADLGLRVVDAGYRIVAGNRTASHPVRPADRWVSVRLQAGNVDDALMGALHGRHWHRRAAAPVGRIGMHVATTVAGAVGISAAVARRPRFGAIGAAAWLAGVGQFAWSRIRPGPRTLSEVTTMLATSVVIPPLATYHRATGEIRARVLRRSGAHALPRPAPPPAAVLFDRDGTLVVDVPYNGDPDLVTPQPGARAALDRLRAAGIPLAVVSNQSGVARGILTADEVHEVNRRVEQLLGPLGPFMVCMHGPADGCGCRKPAGGLIVRAADALGVDAAHCAVIGDIGADMEAARVAGARGILVPTDATRREEARAATEVATDIGEAVDLLIGRRVGP